MTLDAPTVGSFEGDLGTFRGIERIAGKEVPMKFEWNRHDADHPTWRQAYSNDGGQTWEWNWRMSFTRL
jgi:hypothetical protein